MLTSVPRLADHAVRRRELTDVVLALTCERGLDEVSVREVAAGAGVSIGTVQRYFPTKDAMLVAAFRRVVERVVERVGRPGWPADETVRRQVRRVLVELLPLDAARTSEARVWVAFAARALVAPHLAEELALGERALHGWLTGAFTAAVAAGEAPAPLDPRDAAVAVAGLVDGLTLAALGRLAPGDALRALDAVLDCLLPPPRPEEGPS